MSVEDLRALGDALRHQSAPAANGGDSVTHGELAYARHHTEIAEVLQMIETQLRAVCKRWELSSDSHRLTPASRGGRDMLHEITRHFAVDDPKCGAVAAAVGFLWFLDRRDCLRRGIPKAVLFYFREMAPGQTLYHIGFPDMGTDRGRCVIDCGFGEVEQACRQVANYLDSATGNT